MAACLISDVTVKDAAAFETYRARAWYRSPEDGTRRRDEALGRNLILVDGISAA
jgi:uncharacterized protein (DUF1330 family)